MTSAFSLYATLKDKIATKQAHVMTIGLGYVGLPLALTVHESGFPTTGLDLNAERVAEINRGKRVISYFEEDRIAKAVASGTFSASDDPAKLQTADIVLICVPTPLNDAREPDLSYVERAGRTIAENLRPGQLIVLESTVWPGATQNVLRPILEAGGLTAGRDFFLGFSPEREDPGNHAHTTRSIPKIVGADDDESRSLLDQFYSQVVDQTVPVSSTAVAEAVKLTENSFRTVNIALVNEFKIAFDAMGVDVWEVVKAAATKPFGYMPFYPGPGIGGDCIPVSPAYLSWRARDVGSATPIVDLARSNNDDAPRDIVNRVAGALAVKGKQIADAKLLMLGVAYKRDVEDTRESPALAAFLHLERLGASVAYHDPYFPVMPETRDHPTLAGRASQDLSADGLQAYDAVLIMTDHTNVDYAFVAEHAKLIFDARNAFDNRKIAVDRSKLIKI